MKVGLGACFDEETVERMSSGKEQKVGNNGDWKQIYEAGIQGSRDRRIQKEEAQERSLLALRGYYDDEQITAPH